jgi:hypothetical protein
MSGMYVKKGGTFVGEEGLPETGERMMKLMKEVLPRIVVSGRK